MGKSVTIPVRLSIEQMEAVQRLARQHETTDAQILRWAITALLQYVEHHHGALIMPFDFSGQWSRITREVIESDPPTPPPAGDPPPRRIGFSDPNSPDWRLGIQSGIPAQAAMALPLILNELANV